MNAMPTPPKKLTVTQIGTEKSVTIDMTEATSKKPFVRKDRLTHQPFRDNPGLASLRDLLEFAPKGEEHPAKKGGMR